MSQTPEFLYRHLLNLAPTDPRYLAMTRDDILDELTARDCLLHDAKGGHEDADFAETLALLGIGRNDGGWEDIT